MSALFPKGTSSSRIALFDNRYVTMLAYDWPVFVEDLAHGVAVRLRADPQVKWFLVKALNQESIHSHNAFAVIEWARPGSRGWQNDEGAK